VVVVTHNTTKMTSPRPLPPLPTSPVDYDADVCYTCAEIAEMACEFGAMYASGGRATRPSMGVCALANALVAHAARVAVNRVPLHVMESALRAAEYDLKEDVAVDALCARETGAKAAALCPPALHSDLEGQRAWHERDADLKAHAMAAAGSKYDIEAKRALLARARQRHLERFAVAFSELARADKAGVDVRAVAAAAVARRHKRARAGGAVEL